MSAIKKQVRIPNAQRGYTASIVLNLDFLGFISLEKLKEIVSGAKGLGGSWREGRGNWKWESNHRYECFYPLWSDEEGNRAGRSIRQITIRTGCVVRHSQIHAFQNFMADLVNLLAAQLPSLVIRAQLVLVSSPFAIGVRRD